MCRNDGDDMTALQLYTPQQRSMTTPINDGGPAFPVTASTGDPRDGVYCRDGMSLCDWFAGQEQLGDFNHPQAQLPQNAMEALAGYPMPSGILESLKWEADWRAALRFIRADAMLAAREVKP